MKKICRPLTKAIDAQVGWTNADQGIYQPVQHLVSTYQLLQCAFPQGIEEQEYLPLLSPLYEQMFDRSLAQVTAEFTGQEYAVILNDVYRLGAAETSSSEVEEVLSSIKQRLMRCDYEKWLTEC